MRIGTWNINSVRARAERLAGVLERHDLDVLALQETKCKDAQFPTQLVQELGYEVAHVGLNQWNGVALISRVGLEEVRTSFPGQPGFAKDPAAPQEREARAVGARVGGPDGITLWSLYVPNGRELTDRHYGYKLSWLRALADYAEGFLAASPGKLLFMGDFNIAPTDADVWDPSFFIGKTHVSEPERAAFQRLVEVPLREVTRPLTGDGYTYWDYQAGRFPKDEGMRIDFQLASPALAQLATAAIIDKKEREVGSGERPSDHVPVIVDYEVPVPAAGSPVRADSRAEA